MALAATGTALAVIQGTTWFPIGPAPSCCFFPGGEGGRATAVALNPLNSGELWLGTANGGLWRSGDGAASWEPMTDDQASMAIGSIALADCTIGACNSVYAGTGENAIRRDTYSGRGLLVGRRVGPLGQMSWQLRTGTPYTFSRGSIYNVVIDPTTQGEGRTLYVSLSSGVTASASESTVTAPDVLISSSGSISFRSVVEYGLYKSVNDGLTWTLLTVPGAEGHRPTDLEMAPDAHNTLYAGFLGRGIFKSIDAGATWCPLNPGFPIPAGCPQTTGLPDHGSTTFDHVEVAIDPGDADHLYASFGHCPDRLLEDCQPSVYETSDGGAVWTLRFAGASGSTPGATCPAGYSRYTHALAVYPPDPATLYLGGIRLCKSTDHGATWVADDLNAYPGKFGSTATIHFDHRAVVFDDIGVLGYSVNDGGIAVLQYPATRWTPRNENLQAIGFQAIDTSPITPRILGGTQDNSGILWLGEKKWKNTECCGDAGYAVMDETDGMRMFTTTNTNSLSAMTVVPTRSLDGGVTWAHSDSGIPDDDPRSFYPPMVQGIDPTSQESLLYFATNRLFRSSDDADSWTAISPVLSTVPSSEIWSGVDVISAIAVAPSDANRVYLGFYSGRVFATDDALSVSPTWYEMTLNLPAAPITWLAVHPTNPQIVYATLSDFFPGGHVFVRNALVLSHWFQLGAIADLNGVPANTISIERADPRVLWLGTDRGLFKSTNAGGSWFKFGTGLPNAPVYQISLDETRGRAVAATHGRGAFMLTGPNLEAYGGCMNDFVYDLTVFGHGFHPQHTCTMKLLRQDSSVCASGIVDASGGSIQSNKDGALATWNVPYWANDPGVYGCLHGKCLSNKSAAACNVPGNPLSTVMAICDNQLAVAHVPGCPTLANPPSSWFSLTGDFGGFLVPGPEGRGTVAAEAAEGATLAAGLDPALLGSGSFRLVPTLQSADGTSRKLCTVNVPYMPSDTATALLLRARDLVNADPLCLAAGVSAAVQEAFLELEEEDEFPRAGKLHLSAPGLTGSQLIPSVEKSPGPTQSPCFDLGGFGVPVQGQMRIMRLGFPTGPTGAAGGSITVTESSPLGECTLTVPTAPGDTSQSIAAAIEQAFGQPGPVQCAASNPHDVKRVAGGLILVMSTGLQVCVADAGLGLTIAPAETCFADADCDDGNPCTHDVCNLTGGQCQHPPEPNGRPCNDLDACTLGNFCQAGRCGQPVVCNDFNSCTEDACDPATGACLSAPIECDDGNSCTFDVCNPEIGGCRSFPNAGGTCDDGDACTRGDFCDFPPGGSTPVCRGLSACDDGNPCTVETCDPLTGACSSQPVQCDDGNPCTSDFCNVDTGACAAIPTPDAPCDDTDACTIDDHCVQNAAGEVACLGNPVQCDDQDLCTTDSCNPSSGACVHAPRQCDDGLGCTDDLCLPATGQCIHPPKVCEDNNPCTDDACTAEGCVAPDNGGGTADLPPAGCGYTSQDDLMILNGLPPGTSIRIQAVLAGFSCPAATPSVCSFPSPIPGVDCSTGTPPAGERACADAVLSMHLAGTGALAGFVRDLPLPLSAEVRLDPRVPFAPVQSFGTQLFRLFGQLPPGDPAFDLLRITGGGDFGLPSPGQTTLTQSGGDWAVDSFFDMTYRIDFVGRPTGPLGGMSGSTTGTVRIRTGGGACVHQPAACDDGDACTNDSCDPAVGCRHVVPPLVEPGPSQFQNQSVIAWPASPGATHWNSYRGTIPAAMLGSRLPGSVYDQACYESADAFADGATQTHDASIPPVGRAFYYLMSAENGCVESPVGNASSGAVIPNALPCPTPP